MKRELLGVSQVYDAICYASENGKKLGISVKELRKRYGMRKRDIITLIRFLYHFSEANDTIFLNCQVYKPEEDEDILEDDFSNLDDHYYIKVQNYIGMLKEKLHMGDIDITNASLLIDIQSEVADVWKKISDVQLDKEFVIDRGRLQKLSETMETIKKDWINALIKGKGRNISYSAQGKIIKNMDIMPKGLYYNPFLSEYYCVYLNEKKEYEEKALKEIKRLKETGINVPEDDFNIYYYIKSTQRETVVLRVYEEANIKLKLKKLLKENQLQCEECGEYTKFIFKTNNIWQYVKTLKGYGKSVIVEEPADLKRYMMEDIEKGLDYYMKAGEIKQ